VLLYNWVISGIGFWFLAMAIAYGHSILSTNGYYQWLLIIALGF
jgi:hypothetical protein